MNYEVLGFFVSLFAYSRLETKAEFSCLDDFALKESKLCQASIHVVAENGTRVPASSFQYSIQSMRMIN